MRWGSDRGGQIGNLQIRIGIRLFFMHNNLQFIRQPFTFFHTYLICLILFFRYNIGFLNRLYFLFYNLSRTRHWFFPFVLSLFLLWQKNSNTSGHHCYHDKHYAPYTDRRSDFNRHLSFRLWIPRPPYFKSIGTGRQIIISHIRTTCHSYPSGILTLQLIFIWHKGRCRITEIGKVKGNILLRRLQWNFTLAAISHNRLHYRFSIYTYLCYGNRIGNGFLLIHPHCIQI